MKKKRIIVIISLLIIALLLYLYIEIIPSVNNKNITFIGNKKEPEVKELKIADPSLKEIWLNNRQYNNDYVGEIMFDSGLVNLPFVCPKNDYHSYNFFTNTGKLITDYENGCESGTCSGNDVYLRMNWKDMKYNLGGSLFMDYRNNTSDQNIIIYGHYFTESLDKERNLFFTPLEKLLEKENYKENRYLQLVLDNEVRRYEIAYVYIFHMSNSYDDNQTLQYYRTNYDTSYYGIKENGYYQKYINKMEEVKLYDTGVKLTTDDNTLTLQTCLENDHNSVEIVVCKEIEKLIFE